MNRVLLTPEEVANLLKISKYTVYEMVKRGEIPATKIGRKVRIDSSDLERFIEGSKAESEIKSSQDIESQLNSPIMFMGSHDLTIDYLVEYMNTYQSASRLIPAFVGSMEGLLQLYSEKADIAGCHLLDEETGDYNIPIIKRIFSGEKVYVVRFLQRKLGWIVTKGNPKGIKGWEDLFRNELRLVNRQKGAGTRLLLDYHLKKLKINKDDISGYNQIETTHYGSASAVARGDADLALGTESAARAVGVDFVPLITEQYDLVFREEFYKSPKWSYLEVALQSLELREKIKSLGGYDVERMGEIEEVV